jgi:hypothetical protein
MVISASGMSLLARQAVLGPAATPPMITILFCIEPILFKILRKSSGKNEPDLKVTVQSIGKSMGCQLPLTYLVSSPAFASGNAAGLQEKRFLNIFCFFKRPPFCC